MSNQVLDKIKDIQKELNELETKKDLLQAQRVIVSIVRLLDDSVSVDDQSLFQLFTDSDGKIRANASWFYEDAVMTDRKATYKVHPQNNLNLDIKLYGITKPSKRTIAWAQSLTPNFEDEPFNKNFNVGIDFIVPKSADRIIVVLSNNWVIRTLELKGKLTVTFQEILARWAEIKNFDNKTELHNILWESFDIQPLNKKFYSGISERFTFLRQYLVKEKVFDETRASLFANRLLGRVIFCWFLDKKGIINPDQKYFDSESFDNDNEYYKTKLERLFFGVLNTPTGDREFKDDVTPFLNGGLFEARKNDLYNDSKLSFPKNYFDDLFEFLSGYNFTTDESTSQFQQVAIDPEMLGRIFENLLAEMTEETGEQARKAKGAFYTPREIVDYMCKESLKEYLKTKIEKDDQLDQRLHQLIDAPDKDFQDQDHNWRRDWKPYKADILKALDELKVFDPACGSGAFPIGMLQLLVRVYERLEARFDSYKTKLGIIEKNIYGVDIEPMAVEIARLRAWLSIIVDEESDSKKIKPLPNLEFKFICANSLIELDKNGNSTFGDDPQLQEKLESIRDAYFNTKSLNKKKKLRGDYKKLVNQGESLFGESKKSKQLKTYRPFDNEAQAEFFDPQFMFGVVAFDVVIGNPPYVRQEKIDSQLKKELKNLYPKVANGTADLYVYFFATGIKFLKTEGVLSFITLNKFMKTKYGKGLRSLLVEYNVIRIIDFFELPVFEASADTAITLLKKETNSQIAKYYPVYALNEIDMDTILSGKSFSLTAEDSEWVFVDTDSASILNKLKENAIPLGDFVNKKIYSGIKTALNKAFVLNENDAQKLLDTESAVLVKKYAKSTDINRWRLKKENNYFLATGYDIDLEKNYPSALRHLSKFEYELKTRLDQGKNWWNLRPCSYYDVLEKNKIIYIHTAKNHQFYFDEKGHYINNSCYFISTDSKYLLCFLNSKLFDWYKKKIFVAYGNAETSGRVKLDYNKMVSVPVKKVSEETEQKFEKYYKDAKENLENIDILQDIEKKIDLEIYSVFGLTDQEIALIEKEMI